MVFFKFFIFILYVNNESRNLFLPLRPIFFEKGLSFYD